MALFGPALAWAHANPTAMAVGTELARRRYPRFRGTSLLGTCCCLVVVLIGVAIVLLVRRSQRRRPPPGTQPPPGPM
jgi:Na+-driven multidrug efflux pump